MERTRRRFRRDSRALELQLKGYRLSTAEIIYRMPDHPELLQSFIWQLYEIAPDFPNCTNSWISGRKISTVRCIRCA